MSRYHGNKGVVYMSATAAGVPRAVASLSHWSLNMATDKADVTAFGDPNKVYVQGLRDIKGTLAGFWDSADDALFDGAESVDGVGLILYPASTYPAAYFAGPAWLDSSIDVPVGGPIAVSGSFVAAGAWARKP